MPLIVTGTGRCGSSTVARLLHEELGVPMGERFDRPRPPNPQGSFEDLDFRDLHVAVQRGDLERAAFEHEARALVERRQAEHGDRWGFKDPRASYELQFYLDLFDPFVIIPLRDPELVVASIARWYGTPRAEAERETERRLDLVCRAVATRPDERRLYLSMAGEPSDEQLLERLTPAVDAGT